MGGLQTTEVVGTYHTRKEAFEAAKTALLDAEVTKESFAEYDEKDAFKGEWPYPEEAVIHAVGQFGENFLIFVKPQPHGHTLHKIRRT